MLKKICSVFLSVLMIMSLVVSVSAEIFYITTFEENNLPAKNIVISSGHAFVVCGEEDKPDTINIYNLSTKELVSTLANPVYTTGKNYFVEGIYPAGEYMYISWNRSGGSGDPSVRKYKIEDMLNGKLEHVSGRGVRGDKQSCVYDNKIFHTDPKVKILYYINTDTDAQETVMSMTEAEQQFLEYDLVTLGADENLFYMVFKNEIRVYKTENMYQNLMQKYEETVAVYKTEDVISDAVLYENRLYVMKNDGMEIFTVDTNELKKIGSYTGGGEIMAFTPNGETAYVYASSAKSIQVLDISDPENVLAVEEVKVNNENTKGINAIALDGQRIYAADLSDGFTMYSKNELDKFEDGQKAESYAEELALSEHSKAMELCVGLKIMNLRDNGLFSPDSYITRGEFAAAAAKLLGDKANGAFASKEFSDVAKNSKYAEGIYALANLGIISGFSDGTFRPDEAINYEHALAIMLKVMGYYPIVNATGKTVVNVASDIGILNSVKPMGKNNISRGSAARLIYNALEKETLNFVSGLAPYEYKKSGETLLDQMNIRKGKGQVQATEFTSILGDSPVKEGQIQISGIIYKEGNSGAGSFLGRFITFWYSYDETGRDNTIVFAMATDSDEVITIDAQSISEATTKTVFAYLDENEKLVKENIQNASIIFNGKFLAKYETQDLIPDDGEVVIIDSDSDGEVDALIITSYETYVAEAYSKGVFKFKYGRGEIDLNKIEREGIKSSVIVDGYRYDDIENVVGIKQWSVLSVLKSRDEEIVEVYVTNNCIPAMITKLEGNKKVWLDDTEYELSKSYIDTAADQSVVMQRAVIGDDVYAYIDKFGKVAAFEDNNLDAMYGYLVACNRGDGLDADKVQFKMLARDSNELFGSMQIFDGTEKVKINGNRVEDIYAVPELYDENGIKEQLVKFVLNHDGKIKELYTAKDRITADSPHYVENYIGYDEFNFTCDAKITKNNAYRSMGTFEGEPFTINNATQLFMIPSKENPEDKDYKMMDAKAMFYAGGTTLKYDAYLYDVTGDYVTSVMVFKTESGFNVDAVKSTKNIAVVDRFERGLNEEGEEKMTLITAKNADGIQTNLYLADEDLTDETGGIANDKYLGMKVSELPKGSVLQYVKNGYGDVAAVRILHIPSETKTYFEFGLPRISESYLALTFYAGFGKVSKITSAGRVIYNAGGMEANGTIDTANRKWDRNLSVSSASNYLFDSTTQKISSITSADILPGDDILIILQNSKVVSTIVYR